MIYLLAFLSTLAIYCLLSYTEVIQDDHFALLWLLLIFGILLIIFGGLQRAIGS